MRVLITGASGFIGRTLAERLLREGLTVRAAVHRREPAVAGLAEQAAVGAVGPDTDWRAAVADVDVVVHLAGRAHVLAESSAEPLKAFRQVNTDGTARLADQAAAAGVRRFILASSIGVHGVTTDGRGPFHVDDVPAPVEPYAVSKLDAENRLREVAARTSMETAVVRPPLVYGPGAGGNFARLVHWVRQGVPLPLAAVHNRRSLIAVDNLVDLFRRLLDHPAAAGGTFLASDGEDLSTPALIRRLGQAAGRRARLWPVPVTLLRAGAGLVGRGSDAQRLLGSLCVDATPTRAALDWRPPISVDEGLVRAVSGPSASG